MPEKNSSTVVPDDPFGRVKTAASVDNYPSALEVNKFHSKADTDAHSGAIHHTLGIKHDQAAPGDHLHDGVGSRKLLDGKVLVGAKGGNVALANLITMLSNALGFTDSTT